MSYEWPRAHTYVRSFSLSGRPQSRTVQASGGFAKLVRRVTGARLRQGYGGQPPPEIESGGWWTARGSNPRPPHCERGALPAELAAHFYRFESTVIRSLGILSDSGR